MKACDIFKTKEVYKIITQSETDTGLLVSDEPVIILPVDVDIETLKNKITHSLTMSRSSMKACENKEDAIKWQKEQLKLLKEKSFLNLYKNSTNCGIRLDNGILKIYPSKFSEKYKGMVTVKEDIVEFRYSKDKELEVTKKIIELLDKVYI